MVKCDAFCDKKIWKIYHFLFLMYSSFICKSIDCTPLKIVNESNWTWVDFNLFHLIKRTFSFLVDFSWQTYLKTCTQTWVIWVNSNLRKIKSVLREVSVCWTYNRICALDINAHNDQGCTGVESALLSSAGKLK